MTVRIVEGDCRQVLAELGDASVDCVVTSPPYWGLRNYGIAPSVWEGDDPGCAHEWGAPIQLHKGGPHGNGGVMREGDRSVVEAQAELKDYLAGEFCTRGCGAWRGVLGLEPNHLLYVRHMVEVFALVHRVLKPTGSAWIVLGDTFATRPYGDRRTFDPRYNGRQRAAGYPNRSGRQLGLKHKDLALIPARVAIALQEWGWWVRQCVIWRKPSPMPDSATDRCTVAHEYVYHLTRRPKYFYDPEPIREPFADWREGRDYPRDKLPAGWDTSVGAASHRQLLGRYPQPNSPDSIKSPYGQGFTRRASERNRGGRTDGYTKPNAIDPSANRGRNRHSVWTVSSEPFAGGHFATYPTKLILPIIQCSTSERGCCPNCGAPWLRKTRKEFLPQSDVSLDRGRRLPGQTDPDNGWNSGAGSQRGITIVETLGWRPGCRCAGAASLEPVPATVLDPFGGTGTTALVADRLGRDAIMIELSSDYCRIARERLAGDAPFIADVADDAPFQLELLQ